jgi:hypothetical protein
MSEWTDEAREQLLDILPKSQHGKIDRILTALDPGATQPILSVETVGARIEVDRVQTYGLEIGLDGYGNAMRVDFPYGAEVAA